METLSIALTLEGSGASSHVHCARFPLTLIEDFFVAHLIILLERVALDVVGVDERIVTRFIIGDEAIALGVVEELYSSIEKFWVLGRVDHTAFCNV